MWASLCILLILFFKPCFCNGPETELKWKIGIENLLNVCILSYTDGWCLVPFSSNVSCDVTHNVRLCCDYGAYFVASNLFISSEQSTQQANCYTMHAVTNRIPITAKLIRVNEASDWNSSTKLFEWCGMVEGSSQGKARFSCLK